MPMIAPEWASEAERSLRRVLSRRGGVVAPLYGAVGVDDATKAPVLYLPDGRKAISPDLGVVRDGRVFWVEVKAKTEPSFYRRIGWYEHGIDQHCFDSYCELERVGGAPVFVAVYERRAPPAPVRGGVIVRDRAWLVASLHAIRRYGEHRSKWPDGRGGRRGLGGWLWPRHIMSALEVSA